MARATSIAGCLAVCLTLWGPALGQNASPAALPLQAAVVDAMRGRPGAAVVIDVDTGKILAEYHPEVAARRLALPGSSLKPFTLFALLQAGKVSPQTTLMCKRPLTLAGHNLDCTHPDIEQPFDPVMAVAYSCNVWFTSMAVRLTPAEWRSSLLQFGFASPSGLARHEATGVVDLAGTPEELQLQAIGEGGIHVTPLELLRAYQKLALLRTQHEGSLDPLFAGLEASVSYGMGHLAQPAAAMTVAGKTGTSLVEEGAWRHGWFAGYAPADKPQVALVVFLEKGNGPVDAAGVAREIFAAYAARRGDRQAQGASR